MSMNKPQNIIVHHTLTARDTTTFESVNAYHKKTFNFISSLGFYIGYHYFITADGKVTRGRADTDIGAHTKEQSMNYKSIGICLAGNFDGEYPSDAQIVNLKSLLHDLAARYNIGADRIVPHRKYAPKSCYGSRLSDDWARRLVTDTNWQSLLNNPPSAQPQAMPDKVQTAKAQLLEAQTLISNVINNL